MERRIEIVLAMLPSKNGSQLASPVLAQKTILQEVEALLGAEVGPGPIGHQRSPAVSEVLREIRWGAIQD